MVDDLLTKPAPLAHLIGNRMRLTCSLHILQRMQRVKHLGLLQFKEGVSEIQITMCFQALESLKVNIPGLLDLAHGPYAGAEGLNDHFSHAFIMTFEDAKALETYLPHPEHERVKSLVLPHIKKLIVFDFLA